jgi:hypothetical protein
MVDLAPTRGQRRDEQIGDVGARDEHQQADGGEGVKSRPRASPTISQSSGNVVGHPRRRLKNAPSCAIRAAI